MLLVYEITQEDIRSKQLIVFGSKGHWLQLIITKIKADVPNIVS